MFELTSKLTSKLGRVGGLIGLETAPSLNWCTDTGMGHRLRDTIGLERRLLWVSIRGCSIQRWGGGGFPGLWTTLSLGT